LKNRGDLFQWGGAWLCEDGICPTPDGRGNLIAVEIPEHRKPEGHFHVTTRRGKQFNSMIYDELDPFNAADRDDVLMNELDAAELGVAEGAPIVVYNQYGMYKGQAKFVNIKAGNIELHWPEGNVVIPQGVYEEFAGIPEYTTLVIVEKADSFYA